MTDRPILIGAGELLWDLLPGGKQLGGATANFAFHASQLGGNGIIYSAIGTDVLGDEMVDLLSDQSMNLDFIARSPSFPTGTVEVQLDINGLPTYDIKTNVAWDHIPLQLNRASVMKRASAFCFGTLSQRHSDSFSAIQTLLNELPESCLRIFDINLRQHFFSQTVIRESLMKADILKLNEDELPVLAGLLQITGSEDIVLQKLMHDFQLRMIALTKGGEGSLLITASDRSWLNSPKIQIADTVGAGDSFTAALTMGILKNWPLKQIHEMAVQVSAFVCTQHGAMPVLPSKLISSFIADEHK